MADVQPVSEKHYTDCTSCHKRYQIRDTCVVCKQDIQANSKDVIDVGMAVGHMRAEMCIKKFNGHFAACQRCWDANKDFCQKKALEAAIYEDTGEWVDWSKPPFSE